MTRRPGFLLLQLLDLLALFLNFAEVLDVVEPVLIDLELANLLHGVVDDSALGAHLLLGEETVEALFNLHVALGESDGLQPVVYLLHHLCIPAKLPTLG